MIDWRFITSVENAPQPDHRKPVCKNDKGDVPVDLLPVKPFFFDKATFEDAVVMPSYRYAVFLASSVHLHVIRLHGTQGNHTLSPFYVAQNYTCQRKLVVSDSCFKCILLETIFLG